MVRIGAVASGRAAQDTRQALEILGRIHGIAKSLARDDQCPISLLDCYFLDGSLDQIESVIGMGMENADRCLAEFRLCTSARKNRMPHR